MPRKRATRLQQVTKPKPTSMTVSESLSANERKEQLAHFLREFDSRVKKVLKDIDKTKRSHLTFIQTRYEKHILDLPKSIRDMTLKEFAMCGGTTAAASSGDDSKQKRVADILNSKWPEQALEDITEEGSETSVPASMRPPTARPTRRHGGKTAFQFARTADKLLMKTPAGIAAHPIWGQTPLFTPKFDPNLPLTPENARHVRPGERLLMSLAGSPVQAGRPDAVSSAVNKEDITQELSDIAGVQLTPGRIEQMLRVVCNSINQQ